MCNLFYTLVSNTEPQCNEAGVRLLEAEERCRIGAFPVDLTADWSRTHQGDEKAFSVLEVSMPLQTEVQQDEL